MEWGLLSLMKRRLRAKGGSFWAMPEGSSESHEWRCRGGRLLPLTEEPSRIDSLCPWVRQASYRVVSAWSWMGLSWSSMLLVRDSVKRLPYWAINQAEESHILFYVLQLQPNDPMIHLSPKHRCRGGLMATRLEPAVSRVMAFHCRYVLEGISRAKSKQKTLCGSEVGNILFPINSDEQREFDWSPTWGGGYAEERTNVLWFPSGSTSWGISKISF